MTSGVELHGLYLIWHLGASRSFLLRGGVFVHHDPGMMFKGLTCRERCINDSLGLFGGNYPHVICKGCICVHCYITWTIVNLVKALFFVCLRKNNTTISLASWWCYSPQDTLTSMPCHDYNIQKVITEWHDKRQLAASGKSWPERKRVLLYLKSD